MTSWWPIPTASSRRSARSPVAEAIDAAGDQPAVGARAGRRLAERRRCIRPGSFHFRVHRQRPIDHRASSASHDSTDARHPARRHGRVLRQCRAAPAARARGKPVVVGGTGPRGVVAAASYEARRYGVHSAMPSTTAKRLCPRRGLPARRPRPLRSGQRRGATRSSVDHAARRAAVARRGVPRRHRWLRLHGPGAVIAQTDPRPGVGRAAAALLGRRRPQQVPRQAGLGGGQADRHARRRAATATAWSRCCPGEELAFLHPLPVQALWGVGPATLERLQRLGVSTVGDLADLDEADAGRPRSAPRTADTCTDSPGASTTGRSSRTGR